MFAEIRGDISLHVYLVINTNIDNSHANENKKLYGSSKHCMNLWNEHVSSKPIQAQEHAQTDQLQQHIHMNQER